ncbi:MULTISPECIES: GxxExxY protein [unclassified Phenylobacterium]|uniref:GxxExxY protein n=1 Tax=unclassified Phenylobacterium TaxID=2640670 RepID=UPI0009E9ABD3|nr:MULTISPECIES: GxxExxY protein [unclassified Phenylobacterium]
MESFERGPPRRQERQEPSAAADVVARQIVDAGLKVHRALGPGLLESVYEACLVHELGLRGLAVRRQVPQPLRYEGLRLDAGYRLDLLVEDLVIVEVKAVEALSRLHEAQLITYLKLSGLRLGLLVNFNVVLFKDGVRRLLG